MDGLLLTALEYSLSLTEIQACLVADRVNSLISSLSFEKWLA